MRILLALCGALGLSSAVLAQSAPADLPAAALLSVFQRDNGKLVCAPRNAGLAEMKGLFAPFTEGIDTTSQASYPDLARAVYAAFPCPFSPRRAELVPATKQDLADAWLFPDASLRLRHPPGSPAWAPKPGVPHIKCEGVLFEPSGEYRVLQIRGQLDCPTRDSLGAMRQLPRVSSWAFAENGRVRITRTDVPSHVEEWEIYRVREAFSFATVNFAPGDLLAWLRREPGNEIGAGTAFRHLQRAQ